MFNQTLSATLFFHSVSLVFFHSMCSFLSIIREHFQYAGHKDTRIKSVFNRSYKSYYSRHLIEHLSAQFLYIDGCGSSNVINQEYILCRPSVYG